MGIRSFIKKLFNRASSSGGVEALEPNSPSSATTAATTIPALAPASVTTPTTAPDSASTVPTYLPEISVSAPASAATSSGSFPDVVRFGPTSGTGPTLSAPFAAAASGSGQPPTNTTTTTAISTAATATNPVCVACRCPFVERMNYELACVFHPGQVWLRNTQDWYAYVPTLGVQDYRRHSTTRSRAAPRASPVRMQFRGEEPSVWEV